MNALTSGGAFSSIVGMSLLPAKWFRPPVASFSCAAMIPGSRPGPLAPVVDLHDLGGLVGVDHAYHGAPDVTARVEGDGLGADGPREAPLVVELARAARGCERLLRSGGGVRVRWRVDDDDALEDQVAVVVERVPLGEAVAGGVTDRALHYQVAVDVVQDPKRVVAREPRGVAV